MKDISYDFQLKTDMHRKKLSGVPVFLSLRRRPRHGSQRIHETCIVNIFILPSSTIISHISLEIAHVRLHVSGCVIAPLLKPTLPMSKQTRNFPFREVLRMSRTGSKTYVLMVLVVSVSKSKQMFQITELITNAAAVFES
jgi:hypothetical protein